MTTAITAASIAEALRGFLFPSGRPDDLVLLRSAVVNRYLARYGKPSTPDARWEALQHIIATLVEGKRSAAVSGPTASPRGGRGSGASEVIREAHAWEAVYLWCFADPRLTQKAIALRLKVSKSTVERRCDDACDRIAAALSSAEREAERRLMAAELTRSDLSVAEEMAHYGGHHDTDGAEADRATAALAVLWDSILKEADHPVLTEPELRAIGRRVPRSLDDYLLKRVASWQRSPAFEQAFVRLVLWLDQTGVPGLTPAVETAVTYTSLSGALGDLEAAVAVLVGAPGSGKSTLLHHAEQEAACAFLRAQGDVMPFLVHLERLPYLDAVSPDVLAKWLAEQWQAQGDRLESLEEIAAAGRLLLLLDGLNELPHQDHAAYTRYLHQWRDCALQIVERHPGNRVIFSCRTLDYTTPLSSPARRVPRLEIRPLDLDQMRTFLASQFPDTVAKIWEHVEAARLLDVLSVPLYLSLFARAVSDAGELPQGRAGVLATFIRQALRREITLPNPLFHRDAVISRRDRDRLRRKPQWGNAAALPDGGPLLPMLDAVAQALQVSGGVEGAGGQATEVCFSDMQRYAPAEIIDDLVEAALTLGILTEDVERDVVTFAHRELQDFFTARGLAVDPQPGRVARPWRNEDFRPSVRDLLPELHPAEPLPPLPQTGWEEPTVLAVELTRSPDAYLALLADQNLSLAGRCAAVPVVAHRLSVGTRTALQEALSARSRDTAADVRERITCGLVLGTLGDPRLKRYNGPHGPYLLPPLVPITGGSYTIGDDAPLPSAVSIPEAHVPAHQVTVEPFALGTFLVTNAEWALFMASGGYETEGWWDTNAGLLWQRGEITGECRRQDGRDTGRFFRENPDKLDALFESGAMTTARYELWQRRLRFTPEEEEAWLLAQAPDGPLRQPEWWEDRLYNGPAQPVVGITWFEARAYCGWLSAQSGRHFRLPTEAEWEAAARGTEGRRLPYGTEFVALANNTNELHLRRPTPGGAFPEGDSPEGVSDLAGNVGEWTSSAWGASDRYATYPYPYCAHDGREEADVPFGIRRVTRGGSTLNDAVCALSFIRGITLPGLRSPANGMRLACDLP